jgi:hypothetical protein
MKKLLILPILLLASGCGFMSRLDTMNQQIAEMSAKIDETNRLLANVEKSTAKMTRLLP